MTVMLLFTLSKTTVNVAPLLVVSFDSFFCASYIFLLVQTRMFSKINF